MKPETPALSLFICLLLCSGLLPSRADAGLTTHTRELLLAQIEDLYSRLSAPEDTRTFDSRQLQVQIPSGAETVRSFAGCTLTRTPVRVEGQVGVVVRWLDAAARSHWVPKAPLTAQLLPGPGRRIQLETVLWHLLPKAPDLKAKDEALKKLRDNLRWQEANLTDATALLRLVLSALDHETTRIDRLSLAEGRLELSGRAIDAASRELMIESMQAARKNLAKPPALSTQIQADPGVEPDPLRQGMSMAGLPAGTAVLLAAESSGTEVLVVAPTSAKLDGNLAPDDKISMLDRIVARAGLTSKRSGAVFVAGVLATEHPPALESLAQTPVELLFREVDPADAWNVLAPLADTGLLAPAGQVRLTSVLRRRSARQVTGLLAWAQGLAPHDLDGLVVFLPQGAKSPLADTRAENRPVSLVARAAPLAALVAGLTGKPIRDCTPGRPRVDLRVKRTDAKMLLAALLASSDRKLVQDEQGGRLLAPGQDSASDSACVEDPGSESGQPQLLAVLGPRGKRRALLDGGGQLAWLGSGDRLCDGSLVLKIKLTHLVLKAASGRPARLGFPIGTNAPDKPAVRPGPSHQSLADLRLAATSLLPSAKSRAVVVNRQGRVFLLAPGDRIGRRCGRVESILPGKLSIQLDCAREQEPDRALMLLKPSF